MTPTPKPKTLMEVLGPDASTTTRTDASDLVSGDVVFGYDGIDRTVLLALTDDGFGTFVDFKDGSRDIYPIGAIVYVVTA